MRIDDLDVSISQITGVLRRNRLVETIVREIILDNELKDIKLDPEFEVDLLNKFRIDKKS